MTAALNRIAALARRDLVIELSYQFQLVLRLFSILMAIATFFFLGRLVGDSDELAGYAGGYFEFVLIGLVVMGFSQACVNAFGRSIQAAQGDGTFEILLSTSTRLTTLMLGTLVVPMLFAAAEAAIYLAFGWGLTGFVPPLGGVAIAGVLLLLTLGTFAAVGIFSAAVIVLTKRGDPFSSMVLQASNLLAGAMFPIALFPDWLQVVSRFVPAFYGLRGTREVLLAGGGIGDVSADLIALVVLNAVLLPASLFALTRAIRMARITGTLGNR
jgi:ABC-2 type transport system permease protein